MNSDQPACSFHQGYRCKLRLIARNSRNGFSAGFCILSIFCIRSRIITARLPQLMTATPDKKLKLLHVVRRYGPVGGMERYVWELTQELRDLGHEVEVLCEVCLAEKPQGIAVHELGTIAPRPRWLALLRFGRRGARWLKANPRPDWLIHSHERLSSHHITTFHGPPFATVRDRPWWRKVSVRVAMQMYLERRELTVAKNIVPNSNVISDSLAHYYPELAHKLTKPVVPGVTPGIARETRSVPSNGGVIGFVGKEWQRKGLPFAAEIVAVLRRTRPDLHCVVGPQPVKCSIYFAGWQGAISCGLERPVTLHRLRCTAAPRQSRAIRYGDQRGDGRQSAGGDFRCVRSRRPCNAPAGMVLPFSANRSVGERA